MNTQGMHLICELNGCNPGILSKVPAIKHAMEAAAISANATILDGYFHQFAPTGVSGLLCLAESHVSIHTWPESNYAAVDIYTCGEHTKPHLAVQMLAATLEATQVQVREVSRGLPTKEAGVFCNTDTTGETGGVTRPESVDSTDASRRERRSWYVEDADPHERHLYEVAEWLYNDTSKFQNIGIIKNRSYGRILLLDGAVQSSERDEYVYHESLIHPAMISHDSPKNVLILGGGEGASLREVLKHKTVTQATMVDIDGDVVESCRKLLPEWSAGAYDDPRARLVIDDGKKWIEDSTEKFDVIFMDLTDQIDLGPSFALYTKDFYKTVASRMNPGGIFLVQAGELSVCEYFSHSTIRKTLATSFNQVRTYLQHIPTFFAQWSWVAASNGESAFRLTEEQVDERIAARVQGSLRFYDGKAHARMFTLTKDLAGLLKSSGTIAVTADQFEREYEDSQKVYCE